MLQKIHLWVGIVIGAIFSLSGLTGSILVFDDELDVYFNSNLWHVNPQPEPVRLDEATDKVRIEFPNHTLLLARLPREPHRSIEYWIENDKVIQLVYVNPWSLEILGKRDEHAGLLGFLHDFHVHLLAGDNGLLVNGFIGIVLLLTVLTGLWLAWPGWRKLLNALRIPRKESRLARWFALHRSVGLISMILLFTAALTGTAMVFYKQTNAALIAVFGGPGLPEPPLIEIAAPQVTPITPSELLKTAESTVPDAQATWLRFPSHPQAPFVVRLKHPENSHPNGTSYVALNTVTGEVLMNHDAKYSGTGQQIADLKYPLHIGTAAGLPGRLLMFAAGLAPSLLFVTGLYTWWYRRQKPQAKFTKARLT
ncbi:PepSY-associated TM helix domain-containing protein [Nitrosomonas aestuarii]|uniref:PepSY-associated TM helix domain-containing protein n=1 Tax=Nitrosomonas aestuarii TaxID=52441 RepID=UPI000D47E048|nr:PepSY-associated TM helix domain-containing protein [Nitrosomonas aestuarii]PTN13084.1 putative iron-regulated membrane protein [Nitrosomonas aestuarii]